MRYAMAVLVLLLLLRPALSQEEAPKPDTPEQAAEQVLEAFAAGDEAALNSLSEKDNPDPWLVVDELCRRGEHAVALSFAEAAPRAATRSLAAYVSARAGKVDPPEGRELLGRIVKAREAKDPAAVLAAGEPRPGEPDTVPRILVMHYRGVAHFETRDYDAAEATFERVAGAAATLGWLSRVGWARHNVGIVHWCRKDYPGAIEHYGRALAMRQRVGDVAQIVGTLQQLARCHLKLGDGAKALELRKRLLPLGVDLYWPGRDRAQAADLVLAAARVEDLDALRSFAEKDDPDPWLLADELVSRGEREASLAYAGATRGQDTQKLRAYLASAAAKRDPALRDTYREVVALARAKDAEGILTATKGVDAWPGGVVAVHLQRYRAWSHSLLERHRESARAYTEAAARARRLGWLRSAVDSLSRSGKSFAKVPDLPAALARREEWLALEEQRGNRPGIGRALFDLGSTHALLGDHAKAAAFFRRALALKEDLEDRTGMAAALTSLGLATCRQGDYAGALGPYGRAVAIREELGNQLLAADLHRAIGGVHWRLEDWEKARASYEREVALRAKLEDHRGVAIALRNAAIPCQILLEYEEALALHERALRIWQDLGDRPKIARSLADIASLYHNRLADYPRALSHYERSLAISTKLDDRPAMAATLFGIGHLYMYLGDYAAVLTYLERSLAISTELDDRPNIARLLLHIGFAYRFLGDWSMTLSYTERSLEMMRELKDRGGEAGCLGELGNAYNALLEHEKALECFEAAMAIAKELDNPRSIAFAFESIGDVHESRGDLEMALDFHRRSLAIWEELDPYWMAVRLQRIAELLTALGEFEEARASLERSLAMMEELGNRFGQTSALQKLGKVHAAAGDHQTAVRFLDRAARLAKRIRTREALVLILKDLAQVRLDAGEHALALAAVRQGLTELETLLGGLAEGESATGRGKFADLFGIGALAAAGIDDPFAALEFLENGRAGALLETLGGGRAALLADLPEHLLRAEADAKAGEAKARGEHDRALDARKLRDIQETARVLDAAMEQRRAVAARIQREAKRVAGVFYPRAAPLEEIQHWMDEGTVLVVYGLCLEEALALVVRPEGERIVMLGTVEEVEAACSVLTCETTSEDADPALAALRKLLVEPLGLEDEVETVLVSPDGPLGYLPWGALLDVPVACVPSGTTWVVLKEEEREPGAKILALGDPSYEARPGDRAVAVYRGGVLQTLPGTRAEAKAVGDVVLLGKEATEAGFAEALKGERRWRAVHLACHGLLDKERPLRSSLALTPGGGDDGFLTFIDVFGLEIPADLVVLSACETAKGKVAKAEGIVGLTRAFMYAGSPRVICSLWKVDDEATKALMVKFYELWNPKEGEGLSAATALKQAQEFVRSHDKWKHPHYWAAWVLWGLPD